jgi:hypothetical protein
VATGRVLDFGFEGAWLQPRRKPYKINLRLLAAEENRSPQCAFFAAYEVATDPNPKKYGAPLQGLKPFYLLASERRGWKPRPFKAFLINVRGNLSSRLRSTCVGEGFQSV